MSSGNQLALETPGQIFDPQRTLITTTITPPVVPNRLIGTCPANVEAINPILDLEPLADSLQLSTLPS
jgi:hypothetical protein